MTKAGTAKAVLVFPGADSGSATLASVCAECSSESASRLCVAGAAVPVSKLVEHYEGVLLPLLDETLALVGIKPLNYRVTIGNIGAASVVDQGLEVSGYSLDVPLFLALLSCSLDTPLRPDVVATGHLGDRQGRILPVYGLPAKLTAVSERATRFCLPSIDETVRDLRPQLADELDAAIVQAREKIDVREVSSLAALVPLVFQESSLLQGALNQNRFGLEPINQTELGAALFGNLELRFRKCLGEAMVALDEGEVADLLQALMNSSLVAYPRGFGRDFRALCLSLPPSTKHFWIGRNLLSNEDCVLITQHAGESDHSDVRALFAYSEALKSSHSESLKGEASDEAVFEKLLASVDPIAVEKSVVNPVRDAAVSFRMSVNQVSSTAEFYEAVTAFYVHLKRALGEMGETEDLGSYRVDATAMVERAFSRQGGLKAAAKESIEPARGGLRYIFGELTRSLCEERYEQFVQYQLASLIDPLDWEAEVDVVRRLLERTGIAGSEDDIAPESVAGHWKQLLLDYLSKNANLSQILRTS